MSRQDFLVWSAATVWALLFVFLPGASAQLQVVSMVTNQVFPDPSNIIVGSASDLSLQVRCESQLHADTVWSTGGSRVSEGLQAFGVSQGSGILRVYPTKTALNLGPNSFQCSDGVNNLTVQFNLIGHLFFTEPVPEQASSTQDITSLCKVPDVPAANVTAVAGTGFSYCLVETARGTFRSRSILIEQEPSFSSEPKDIIVSPLNGTSTTAAFSCSVDASVLLPTLVSIQWYFEMMNSTSAMNQLLTEGSGVSIFSGTNGVADSKTSILVLSGLGNEHEGLYRCVATFQGGRKIVTRNATLVFDNVTATGESIILAPPSSITLLEGGTLLIPCVSSRLTVPHFSRVEADFTVSFSSGVTESGLELMAVTVSNSGEYRCRVGEASVTNTTVTVIKGLSPPAMVVSFPPSAFFVQHPEVVTMENASVRFRCNAVGVRIEELENGQVFASRNVTKTVTLSFGVGDSGFYQCGASRNDLPVGNLYTDETLSTYILVAFFRGVIISPVSMEIERSASASIALNCTAEGNPILRITWTVNTSPAPGSVQVATGFMEPAFSSLTIPTADLNLGINSISCTAAQESLSGASSVTMATVIVLDGPVIKTKPQSVAIEAPGQAVFTCIAEGLPVPNITWINIDSDNVETNLEPSETVLIDSSATEQTVTSTLTFTKTDLTLVSRYACVATNRLNTVRETVQLLVNASPVVLVSPDPEVIAVTGDPVTLNCTAQGNPIPSISWMVNSTNSTNAITPADPRFTISSSEMAGVFTATSIITFLASENDSLVGNLSMFYCTSANVIGSGVESEPTVLIIAGPPLSPALVTVLVTSRSSLISWEEPFSLIPVTNYTLVIVERRTDQVLFTVTNSSRDYNAISLSPSTEYSVSIKAENRAGLGPAVVEIYRTLEDVPTGTPQDVTTSSRDLEAIRVQWSPLPGNQTNGVIIGYSIRFRIDGQANMAWNVSDTLSAVVRQGVVAGATYLISVAARTQVGVGPYSSEVQQTTISSPPVFPTNIIPTSGPPTVSTIPIMLPRLAGAELYSHYWVIVFKVGNPSTFDETTLPTNLFQNNSSFTNYSSSVPIDTPYIVAEISASSYSQVATFAIGDEESSKEINDVPDYQNGPLQPGITYSAFVWGFPSSVPNGDRVKRQNSPRQYSVFSSSSFTSPTQTATLGLTGGAIAGIVIAIILFFVLAIGLIILSILIFERYKISTEEGLPRPHSRKGSMRIRDAKEVIPVVRNHSIKAVVRNYKAEAELQNLNPDDLRLATAIEVFPSYVKSLHANTDHLFSEEYEILSIKSPSLPHVNSSLPFNVAKNRYANINCYDDTRVHLDLIPGIEGTDYINGNYIDGYMEKKEYIATQGPLAQTSHDFWRMVWEKNSCCIIMLTNVTEKNRVKCHQYWPEVGSLDLGEITVTLIEIQQLAYYTIRTFRMSRGNDRREVKQFHYTGWPDFGVPDYSHPVVAFIKRLNNFKRTTPGPYVIHCSAGVGRTGTLVTIRAMMNMVEEEGKVDVFNFVLGLRHQRNYMVQTERQYIFIHDCVLEIQTMGETAIPIQTLRSRHKVLSAHNAQEDMSKMEMEYARLNELEVSDMLQFEPAKLAVNAEKNRFSDILPYDRYRVRLLMAPGVAGSDYINASYIDGYQHRHQYIVTQGPMKNTVKDFWKMIWEHRVSCILMLSPLEEKGQEQSVRYWPTEKITQQGEMFIELTQMSDFPSYTMREFSVTNTKINESRVIKHYQYSDWLEDVMPTNAAAIIDLIGVLQKTQHMSGGGPIVVHDSSSIGRSATFCILSSILEQLKVEGTVDLFSCVHSLRHQQPGLINSFKLYQFCYQAVIEFLDSFDHYANFD